MLAGGGDGTQGIRHASVLTSTEKMSFLIQALSWTMSLMETPQVVRSLANSAIPPGRSLTVTVNLTRRPSAANPRSKHRPRMVVSIFPPQSGMTTFFPVNSGKSPARTAATPVAPPPSTTAFSISTSRKIEMAIHSSDTVTSLSMRGAKRCLFRNKDLLRYLILKLTSCC